MARHYFTCECCGCTSSAAHYPARRDAEGWLTNVRVCAGCFTARCVQSGAATCQKRKEVAA